MALRRAARGRAGTARRRRRRGVGWQVARRLIARLPSRGCVRAATRSSWTKSSTRTATSSLGLRGTWSSPSALEDRDLVLVGVEADVRARDVVHDDRVERPCAPACPARAVDALGPCSAAKPISDWPGAGAARQPPPARRRCATRSTARRSRPPWRSCRRCGRCGPEVGDRRRHQQQVACSEARRASRRAAPRRSRRHVCDAGRARQRRCSRRSPSRRAPRRAASAASAKPMRPLERLPTIAHRVERLARPAGGDQHPHAVERPRRARRRTISIASRIAAGSASRPTPHSPREASGPVPGSTTCTPRARSVSRFACVARVLVHAVVHRRRDAAPAQAQAR